MTDAEADVLNILSKTMEAAEAHTEKQMRQGALNTREGELGGDTVITYAVAEVPKENSNFFVKNMTEAEADALNILSKTTEEVKEPMEMEMIDGDLKTRKREHWEGDSVFPYEVSKVGK